MADQQKKPTQAEVVKALADLASQGVYKEVTPAGARNMNAIFALTAELINELEAAEAESEARVAIENGQAQQGEDDESV